MSTKYPLSDRRSVDTDYVNSRCRALLNYVNFSMDNISDVERIEKFMRDRKLANGSWYNPALNLYFSSVVLPTKPVIKIKESAKSKLTAIALVGVRLADLGDVRSKMYV